MGWKCASCRFYFPEKGECRMYAPRIISGSGTGWSDQYWPTVSPDDFCGQYERKEEVTHE